MSDPADLPDDETEPPSAPPSRAPEAWGHALAAALCAAATLLAVLTDHWLSAPNVSLIFVLPVVIVAVGFGWRPAMLAALLGALAFNFFLIEPRYSFRVADPANLWALGLLLTVGAICSGLAAVARARALEAEAHARRAEALQGLTRSLTAAKDRGEMLTAAVATLGRVFDAPAAVLLERDGALEQSVSPDVELSSDDLEAGRWTLASGSPMRAGEYPAERARFDFWPVATRSRLKLALGARLKGGGARPESPAQLIEIVGGHLAVALERERYAGQAFEARVSLEGERVKADLLAAVSHDLRTPLSTILFTLQSLQRFAGAHDAGTRAELLALAETETARLIGLVGKLLDMSRIEAGAMAVATAPTPVAELAVSALQRAGEALRGRRVINEVADGTALVQADAALVETALANVLENAAKYSPPGSTITLRARPDGDALELQVLDEGPGFPPDADRLFEKFARGVEGDGRPPGTGLGLSIARGFLQAQGGSVRLANRVDERGALVALRLPIARASDAAPASELAR